jgi:hypothetical protein
MKGGLSAEEEEDKKAATELFGLAAKAVVF